MFAALLTCCRVMAWCFEAGALGQSGWSTGNRYMPAEARACAVSTWGIALVIVGIAMLVDVAALTRPPSRRPTSIAASIRRGRWSRCVRQPVRVVLRVQPMRRLRNSGVDIYRR